MSLPRPPVINQVLQESGTVTGEWNRWFNAIYNLLSEAIVNAPSDAPYIIQTLNELLPNAQALGILSTGFAKVTHGTGVISTQTTINTSDITATGVVTGTYGNASQVPTLTISPSGQITTVSSTNIAIDASAVSGILPVTTGGTGVTTSTGTGSNVLSTSPTLVTPLLGTPTSGVLTNCTGLPEGGLSLTDITTNNSSTTKHGFLLKLDNNAAHFMNGTGAWSAPAAAGWTVIGVTVYSTAATNTFTPNVNTTYVTIELVGGGGAGGGVSTGTTCCGAGGGGAGGYCRSTMTVATLIGAGSTAQIITGAAGTVGTAGNNPGGAGLASTVKANGGSGATLMTANGGAGGLGNAPSTGAVTNSVLGGTASGGDVNIAGQQGAGATSISVTGAAWAMSGAGGSGPFGAGGRAQGIGSVSGVAGIAGLGNGSGGGGAACAQDNTNNHAGGAGTAGLAIIYEYRTA